MIHPSYVELMKVVNANAEIGEEPVVNSRYSIVCATAKRARQIIDGSEPMVNYSSAEKPLSIAVDELYQGKLKILTDEEAEEARLTEEAAIAAKEAAQKAVEAQKSAPPLTGDIADFISAADASDDEPEMTDEEIAEELLDEEEDPETSDDIGEE